MKFLIASDIHGSAAGCRRLLEAYEREGAQRLVLLGDILYHGPRNDLPGEYAPKEVIRMLNEKKDEIYAVRGNCEAEVDQMVLEFPVLADYMILLEQGHAVYATHGHVYNRDHLPPMKRGDVLLQGHTHIFGAETEGDILILNDGSVSLPKQGNPATYMTLEDGVFRIMDFEGNCLRMVNI